jgi:hypothetical protein
MMNGFLVKKLWFIPVLFLLCSSCTKEFSAEGRPFFGTFSIFTDQIPDSLVTENDASTGYQVGSTGIELGLKFRSAVAGHVNGIKYYRTPGNTGTHTAQLYASDGTLLASRVFQNETDTGWQTVFFEPAIPIAANTTYIAAYHSSGGYYTSTAYGLKTAITNGPLTALADSSDGSNGLYKYTDTPAFPDRTFMSNNYWIDIVAEINVN